MWGLDFPHFTPRYKRTILKAIDNCAEIKSSNWEQMGLLGNFILGGNGASQDLPANLPLNGTMKSATSTLFRIKEIGSSREGNCSEMYSHWAKLLWSCPGTKGAGSLKTCKRGQAWTRRFNSKSAMAHKELQFFLSDHAGHNWNRYHELWRLFGHPLKKNLWLRSAVADST